jgi:hypothetical protein
MTAAEILLGNRAFPQAIAQLVDLALGNCRHGGEHLSDFGDALQVSYDLYSEVHRDGRYIC